MSETLTTARTDDEQRAYNAGLDRGWDHENFVQAYGKEHDRRTPDYPSWLHLDFHPRGWIICGIGTGMTVEEADKRRLQRAHFADGWKEGRKRYRKGQYPDGTRVD